MGTADTPIFDKFYTFSDTLRMQDLRLNFQKISLEDSDHKCFLVIIFFTSPLG